MRPPTRLITDAHDQVRALYGSAIGRSKYEVTTPALIVEPAILRRNLGIMQARLPGLHARLRGHVKNHKSPHIARMQLEHGAFGLCAATVWEAIVMVRAGADDVLIANQLVTPQKRRGGGRVAREAKVTVNVDDISDAEGLSAAAVAAGTTIGVLVEVDTGMHRAGVDSPDEALTVARRGTTLPRWPRAGDKVVRSGSRALVLEADLEFDAVLDDCAVLHDRGRLHDLDRLDVADRPRRGGDRLASRVRPRLRARADHLPDDDDSHGETSSGSGAGGSDGRFDEDGDKRIPLDVAEGDEVLYSKYGGTEITVEGDEVLVLRESDVLAKVV